MDIGIVVLVIRLVYVALENVVDRYSIAYRANGTVSIVNWLHAIVADFVAIMVNLVDAFVARKSAGMVRPNCWLPMQPMAIVG